jgi:hypothetical protein
MINSCRRSLNDMWKTPSFFARCRPCKLLPEPLAPRISNRSGGAWKNYKNIQTLITIPDIQTPDFSRRHHRYTSSSWENIWRKVVHIDQLNNVSSNLFQNILSSSADHSAKCPIQWYWWRTSKSKI